MYATILEDRDIFILYIPGFLSGHCTPLLDGSHGTENTIHMQLQRLANQSQIIMQLIIQWGQ